MINNLKIQVSIAYKITLLLFLILSSALVFYYLYSNFPLLKNINLISIFSGAVAALTMLFGSYISLSMIFYIKSDGSNIRVITLLIGFILLYICTYIETLYLIFQIQNFTPIIIFEIIAFPPGFTLLCWGITEFTRNLDKRKENLITINKEMKMLSKKIYKRDIDLEKVSKDLEYKNKELENAVEDFYTLKLHIDKSNKDKSFYDENENIRKRIDLLKSN